MTKYTLPVTFVNIRLTWFPLRWTFPERLNPSCNQDDMFKSLKSWSLCHGESIKEHKDQTPSSQSETVTQWSGLLV